MRRSLFFALFLASCIKSAEPALPPVPAAPKGPFEIVGSSLMKNGAPAVFKGVNAMQTFGLTDSTLLQEWEVEITREFIGNLREQPIDGGAIQGSDGAWLHPLQTIVDANRAQGRVTVLCPFGWVDSVGVQSLFTGLNPKAQWFYPDYLLKMQAIAAHFKDQTDVWIEVWNEPFHWNNQNGYSHALWLETMEELVDNLRWVSGFESIILVPGNEQGQGAAAILEVGSELLEPRYNLLFDLHAYEKWLVGTDQSDIQQRISALHDEDVALFFGEVGVQNVSNIMPVQHFCDAVAALDVSTCAWLWNTNSADPNALLTDDGLPHADSSNNYWGQVYRLYLSQ